MTLPQLNKLPNPSGSGSLRTTALREFDGGWNVIDNDLSLSAKFSEILDNLVVRDDKSLELRHGTRLFVDLGFEPARVIIEDIYYNGFLVAVDDTGEVHKIDGVGTVTTIWSHTIANQVASLGDWANNTGYVVGDVVRDATDDSYWKCAVDHTSAMAGTFVDDRTANPTFWTAASEGWDATDFVSMTTFKDRLIICNGINKPLRVDFDEPNECDYLVDEGTGSNANTPICRYVFTMPEFVVMAGDPAEPSIVHISSQGTSGTYVNDPAPNNAVQIDIAQYVHISDPIITGLNRFRQQLVVGLNQVMALGTLGIFDGSGNHTPDFSDVIEAHGCIAHRSMVNLGDDMLFADNVGVPSLARSVFTQTIVPDRASELIDPEIQRNLNQLSVGTVTRDVFAVYNLLEKQYMLFIPNHDESTVTLDANPIIVAEFGSDPIYLVIESVGHGLLEGDMIDITGATGFNTIDAGELNTTHEVKYVIDENRFTIELSGVAIDVQQDLQGGGESVEYSAQRTRTVCYVYHNRRSARTGKRARVWARFRGWNWRTACRTALGTIFFSEGQKIYIYGTQNDIIKQDFVDDNPTDISFTWELPWAAMGERSNTKGLRYFGSDTRGMARFTMQIFVDDFYKDFIGRLVPALEMDFIAGDSGGYGSGTQPYGGGRITSSEKLFALPAKMKLLKMRLSGTTNERLRIIALLLGYLRGSIRR